MTSQITPEIVEAPQPFSRPAQDTTHERIAKGESYIGDNGARYFTDSVIQRLAAKGDLGKNSRDIIETAERYYTIWYTANMNPLAAFDPTRVFSGGGESGGGMPASARQASARGEYRDIVANVDHRFLSVVDRIVLQEQADLVAVGREASGKKSDHACRAIAIERLVAGLVMVGARMNRQKK